MTATDDSVITPFDFTHHERLDYEQTLLRLTFASLIESHLEATGIQAQQLAARMGRFGRTKAWVSKLLGGNHNPTVNTLAEVANALGLRWKVALTAAPRAGTPAASDPPAPPWVQPHPTPFTTSYAVWIDRAWSAPWHSSVATWSVVLSAVSVPASGNVAIAPLPTLPVWPDPTIPTRPTRGESASTMTLIGGKS